MKPTKPQADNYKLIENWEIYLIVMVFDSHFAKQQNETSQKRQFSKSNDF